MVSLISKKQKIEALIVMSLFMISTTSLGIVSVTNDNYFSGRMIASDDYGFIFGDLVYRSVENTNVSVTSIETDFGGVAPFEPYFAQSLKLNESMFYLSNGIAGFEIFNDTNHNGYIDSVNEIEYFVMLNATQGFEFSPITKQINNNSVVYQWTSHYYNIDGFPLNTEPQTGNEMKKIIIPSFNITYTLTDSVNTSSLSIQYDIGAFDAFTFTVDQNYNDIRTGTIDLSGLGLSMLYTSVIRSFQNVTREETSNNGVISNINFKYGSNSIFESNLDDSYRLANDQTKLPVKTVIVQPETLLPDETNFWRINNDYLSELKGYNSSINDLPGIPSDSVPTQILFNYRINYPLWDGQVIHHDPVFTANKNGIANISPHTSYPTSTTPTIPTSPGTQLPFTFPSLDTFTLLFVSGLAGILVIGIVVVSERRKLK